MDRVDGLLLDGREVALVAVLVEAAVRHRQRVNGTVHPELLQLRDDLTLAAKRTTSVLVTDGRGHADTAAAAGVAASGQHEMTVQAAAGALQVSQRTARRLCESGALPAVKAADGHWRIDPGSVAALAARRKGEVTP